MRGLGFGSVGDWFGDHFVRRVNSGRSMSFWLDIWIGVQPLRVVFPRLFLLSIYKEGCVDGFGSWVDGVWRWDIRWRHGLFVLEEALVEDILGLIRSVVLSMEEDFWVWLEDPSDVFSIRLAYARLSEGTSTVFGL